MDQEAWVACDDPDKMLRFLQDSGRASDRRFRLFGCACVRRVWHLLNQERSRNAIETAEQHADGEAREEKLLAAEALAILPAVRMPKQSPSRWAAFAAWATCLESPKSSARLAARNARWAVQDDSRSQCDLLRDLIGPLPFCSVTLAPSVRTWNGGLIVKLAAAIYEERSLPEGTLDNLRLSVLGDALEEAGVTNPDILGHCRQPGAVHVRGCFLVDLVLDRK